MSEGTEQGVKEGAFVNRYTKGQTSGIRRSGSRYPEKQGQPTGSGSSRYPEKNAWNPKSGRSKSYSSEKREGREWQDNGVQVQKGRESQSSASQIQKGREGQPVGGQIQKSRESQPSASQIQKGRESQPSGIQIQKSRESQSSASQIQKGRESQPSGIQIQKSRESQPSTSMTRNSHEAQDGDGREREVSGRLAVPERKKEGDTETKTKADISEEGKQTEWRLLLRKRKVRRLRIAAGCFFGLMAVIYIGVAVYFGSHFYEGTVIYGVDCSQMTEEEAKAAVSDRLGDYTLTLLERGDVQETVSARQIELKFHDNGSIGHVLETQRSYVWPVMILIKKSSQASVKFTYNEEKVKKLLSQMDCFNDMMTVKPQDAYIGTTERGFEVVPEVEGNTLDQEKALKAVIAALDGGAQTLSFEEKNCYLAPEIRKDDRQLIQDAASMNELVQAEITYDFGDRTEIVDVSVIKDWIVKLDDGSFVIDDGKVSAFVEELAEKYDTFGMNRDFYTSYGTVVSLSGGDYGWAIDQDATTLALLRALEEGYQGVMEPEYAYTAMSRDTNDIGYTYVEICISQQRMICYKDGVAIVDTPVVTGNPNKGNATPAGSVWAIDAKMRDYVLVGEGYRAPVDYWMPFNGDIGIHDLKERAYFGGTIYLTNGSHGCVNTPYDQVAVIYDAVSVGTPVIVYDTP